MTSCVYLFISQTLGFLYEFKIVIIRYKIEPYGFFIFGNEIFKRGQKSACRACGASTVRDSLISHLGLESIARGARWCARPFEATRSNSNVSGPLWILVSSVSSSVSSVSVASASNKSNEQRNAWTVGGRQTTDGRGVGSLARTEEEEGRGG